MQHAPTGQQMMSPQVQNRHQTRQYNANVQYSQNGQIDPFGRVNQKARKVIESVERQRQTPADPRAGSTGGSFDDEFQGNVNGKIPGINNMNHTAQNFYNPQERTIDVGRNYSVNNKVGHPVLKSPIGR